METRTHLHTHTHTHTQHRQKRWARARRNKLIVHTFNIFKFLERMNSPSLLFFFFFLVFISKHFSTRLSIWNLYQEWGRGRNDANTLYNSSGQPRVQLGLDGPNIFVVSSSLKSNKSLSWETTYYYINKIPKSLLEFVWNSDPLLESSLRRRTEKSA